MSGTGAGIGGEKAWGATVPERSSDVKLGGWPRDPQLDALCIRPAFPPWGLNG